MKRRLVHPDHVPETPPTVRRRLVAPVEFQPHRFIHGSILTALRSLKRGSVRIVVTSPPYYGLRAYGTVPEIWGGREGCVHQWTCYLQGKRQRWGDTSTLSKKQASNRGSLSNVAALERDGGRYCFNCNAWEGELGQEACVKDYVNHLVGGLEEVRSVLSEDGTMFLNLGDNHCFGAEGDCKPKDLFGVPWSVAFELRRRGWYLRNAIVWEKPNTMPRSIEDCFTPSYEMVFLLSKSSRYHFDFEAVMEPVAADTNARYARAEMRQVSSSSVKRKNDPIITLSRRKPADKRRKRDVWHINTKGYRKNGIHYATFPEALVEPCILAGSEPGDVVLDCFAGICTTAAVAARLGRRSVSLDLNEEFLKLGRKRVIEVLSER